MKVVINAKFGGFGLSEAAYEKLHQWGVPIKAYIYEKRDPETQLYLPEPLNDGEVIFDRTLSEPSQLNTAMIHLSGKYWDTWTKENRTHPLLIRVVEELKDGANGRCSKLKIVEIPDGTDYQIDEYDGLEHVAEKHRVWS